MCAMPLLWILCLLAHSISASKLNVPRETGNCGEEPPRYNDMIRANTHRVASQPRNLLAITAVHSPAQMKLVDLFVESIFLATRYLNFTTIITTDQSYFEMLPLQLISKLAALRAIFIRLRDPQTRNKIGTMKYAFMTYLDMSDFDRVLFLDTDILIIHDIMAIFTLKNVTEWLIYTPAEGWFNGGLWTYNRMPRVQCERLAKKGIRTFNSGTVLFQPGRKIIGHFRKVIRGMRTQVKINPSKMDQRFLNDYFNSRFKSRTAVFKGKVCFRLSGRCNVSRSFLVHCCGYGSGEEKLVMMRFFRKKRLNPLPLAAYPSYVEMMEDLMLPKMRILMLGAIPADVAAALLSLQPVHLTAIDTHGPDCVLSKYRLASVYKYCPSSTSALQLTKRSTETNGTFSAIELVPYQQLLSWAEGQEHGFFDVLFLYGSNAADLLTHALFDTLRVCAWVVLFCATE